MNRRYGFILPRLCIQVALNPCHLDIIRRTYLPTLSRLIQLRSGLEDAMNSPRYLTQDTLKELPHVQ